MRATALVILVVAAECGAVLLPAGPSPHAADKPDARPKWEYQVLTGRDLENLVKDDDAFKKAKNVSPFKTFQEQVAASLALNKLGDDGWELSAVVVEGTDQDNQVKTYYSKRPK
jgi:hypothetical protein